MFENTPRQELVDGIAAVLNPPRAEEPLPLPAAAPSGMTPAQQETLFENWVSSINSRRSETWTREEREAIRVACARALRTL
jgi:hypothetical protein